MINLLAQSLMDPQLQESFVCLSVSLICGLLIGSEREYRGKAAGLRTNILICMGSCLFMIISKHVAETALKNGFTSVDPSRIAAQVVSGIGFLGAGAIIRHRGGISGLTTAAGIWGMAAIGLAAGSGMYLLAIVSSIGYVLIIEIFYYLAKIIRLKTYRYMKVVIIIQKSEQISGVRKVIRDMRLQYSQENTEKVLGEVHYTTLIYLKGNMEDKIMNKILKQKGVKDVQIFNSASEL